MEEIAGMWDGAKNMIHVGDREDLLKRMEVSVKEFPRDGKARDKICKGTEVEGKDLFGKISVNKQVMLF